MTYYLLSQELLVRGAIAIGDVPEEIDPLEWIRGRVVSPPPNPLRLMLSEASGEFFGDIVEPFVTVYSTKLRSALTAFGVDNVEYFPVELEHPRTHRVEREYWLANVVGRVSCVDLANSTYTPSGSGKGLNLEGFVIDSRRAPDAPLFRLDEQPTLVVINEALQAHLAGANLRGVRMTPTEEYEGD